MNEDVASTLRLLDEALARYVRPDCFPLAIRMLKPGEAVPEGVKIPSKTMGEQWIVCQSVGVARRYGWGIAVGKDDVICPLAAIAFGFRKPNEEYLKGSIALGMYCKDEPAAANLEASTWRFEPGTYESNGWRERCRPSCWMSAKCRKVTSGVTDRVNQGVVYMTYQWWVGACNELTIDYCDPIAKTPEYKYCAVRVEATNDQSWAESNLQEQYSEIKAKLRHPVS